MGPNAKAVGSAPVVDLFSWKPDAAVKNSAPKSAAVIGQMARNTFADLMGGMLGGDPSNISSPVPLMNTNVYYPITLNPMNLTYMYKSHGIAQKMVDMPVLDAFAGGFDFTCDTLDEMDLKEFHEWLTEHEVLDRLVHMVIWGRLYGGGALVCNILDLPKNKWNPMGMIDGPVEFYDANRWEVGSPLRHWPEYQFYGQTIDASKVLTYAGKRAPYIIRQQVQGWGMSVFEPSIHDMNLFTRNRDVVFELLREAKVDVFKYKGLVEALMTPDGTTGVMARTQMANRMKSYNNALVMDSEDEYEQKQIHFSGLGEVNEMVMRWFSALSGIAENLSARSSKTSSVGRIWLCASKAEMPNARNAALPSPPLTLASNMAVDKNFKALVKLSVLTSDNSEA